MVAQSGRLQIVLEVGLERVMAGHLDDFAAIHQAPPNPFARCLSALEPDQTELRSEQQLDFLLWGSTLHEHKYLRTRALVAG